MDRRPVRWLSALCGAAALLAVFASPVSAQDPFVITGVRLFDGERVIPSATVVVRDGRIAAAGPDIQVPADARPVDGAGRTLLPGLMDAHAHTPTDHFAETALVFGVTTIFDMMTAATVAERFRREQRDGRAHGRADVFSASTAVTAPGGHGTQFGLPIPTLGPEDDVDAFIADRIEEGADFIKVILEDGSAYGTSFQTFDEPTVEALVRAARAHERTVVFHVGRLRDARVAVRAGVDGLVHVWSDSLPDAALLRELVERGVFVVPTLTVIESVGGGTGSAAFAADERFAPFLGPAERQRLSMSFPARDDIPASFDVAFRSVSLLAEAGVTILAGSDTPNPGTVHGASVHRELELLVAAGLEPIEALSAATSVPARAFGLEDRGRIAPGLRADLLLVEGDPTEDVTATRNIVSIWKAGVEVERAPFRERVAVELEAAAAAADAPAIGPGMISDFDDGELTSTFGMGWHESTDQIMGGRSTVELEVVEGGAAGTDHALRIRGEVVAGAPFTFAGAMFFPGSRPMAPRDLSGASGLRFRARGDAGTYQLMLFTESGGQMPAARPFEVGEDWQEIRVEWSDLGGGSDVTGIAILGGPAPGVFTLWIDQVELY